VKVAYFDLSNGVSGDMVLAALVEAGAPVSILKKELKKLPLTGYAIRSAQIERMHLAATKIDVHVSAKVKRSDPRFSDIRKMLKGSSLSPSVKKKSLAIFERLGRAEAFVHGTTLNKVKFHEIGAVDSVIDIVGSVIAFDHLEIEEIYASAFYTGSGSVSMHHGTLPLPSPATAKLLEGYPVHFNVRPGEMTTPTGAAIITTLAKTIGASTSFNVRATGRGAGSMESCQMPNILRVFIGEKTGSSEADEVYVIETNIDDMPGEVYGIIFDRLFHAGALDVFASAITMKKSRPAYLLSVIAEAKDRARLEEMILRETSTFGVRSYPVMRRKLARAAKMVMTPFGKVRVKTGILNGRLIKAAPEYEDCRRIAESRRIPFIRVYMTALKGAERLFGTNRLTGQD